MLGYELIGEVVVNANTTEVSFNGLNLTTKDEVLLVTDMYVSVVNSTTLYMLFNGDYSHPNYARQELKAINTSISAYRANNPAFFQAEYGCRRINVDSYIRLTEAGLPVSQNNGVQSDPSLDPLLQQNYVCSKTTSSSISSIAIRTHAPNLIGVGSTFKLYKLVSELIADITVSSNTTEVNVSGLDFNTNNQMLIVSDVVNPTSSYAHVRLFINGNTTLGNYSTQAMSGSATTLSSFSTNAFPQLIGIYGGNNYRTTGRTQFSLSSHGYTLWKSDAISKYEQTQHGHVPEMNNNAVTSLVTFASITQLKLNSSVAGAIGAGSRFKIYKLV